MRDCADLMTAEIPVVEPLPPPPPPRKTIAVRMAECSYAGPLDREDTCRHCKHRVAVVQNADSWAESETHRCKLHGFPVQLGAVCDEHARAAK